MSENKNKKSTKSNIVLTSLIVVTVVAAVIIGIIWGTNNKKEKEKQVPDVVYEDTAESFVESCGYEVEQFWSVSSPYVPEKFDDYYTNYNALQKSQGYDLSEYKGIRIQEYVYLLKDFTLSGRKAYMTILMYKGEVIGGHISTQSGDGKLYTLKGELYE